MKKIILKFIGVGINDQNQALIYVYDKYGKIICKKRSYNGYLIICLEKNDIYRLVATICNDVIRTNFYVSSYSDKYTFVFGHSILKNNPISARTITFLLTDANYSNLPVEKGEMMIYGQNN